MGVILFGVVVFGIINTLFMSLYERMFEFGVLRAVGTRPFGMARVILFEAGALAIVSIGLGMILGFVLIYPVWLFIFTIIAGLYPARYAAKMSPAAAMRRSF